MSASSFEKSQRRPGQEHVQMDWKSLSYALVNASPNGVFLLDGRGLVLFSNQAAQTDLGITPGSELRAVLPEFWLKISSALSSHEDKFRVTFHTEGFTYFAKLSSMYWKRRFLGMLCIIEDTTEIEETLECVNYYHQACIELEGVINSSSDGIWVCDADATVLRINKASEILNNIQAEEIVGRNMEEVVDMGLVDTSVTLKVIQKQKNASILQNTKDGRKLLVSGSPVFNNDGKLFRIVVNERDVSELYSLQYQLEEHKSLHQSMTSQLNEFQCLDSVGENVVIKSENMLKIFFQAQKIAPTDSTALLLGETGVGKGLLAKFIHENSHRANGPFVKINCGSIPETLLESELFGYEKGAFTGAESKGKCGKFELAHKGTLFLDEINDLPSSAQVKLLHFLEDSCITRVGGTESKKLDVRIIAASNKDLATLVTAQQFRSDLFYRLNVIPVSLPPLRERKECILPLLQHYISNFSNKVGLGSALQTSPQALSALLDYHYPGNVRELINLCERLVVTCRGRSIEYADLPSQLRQSVVAEPVFQWNGKSTLRYEMENFEKSLLQCAQRMYSTQHEMAQALGVQQSTVARKLKKFGLTENG